MRHLAGIVLFSLLPAAAGAAPVRLSVEPVQIYPPGDPVSVRIRLVPQKQDGKPAPEPVEISLTAPGEKTFDLPDGIAWTIRAVAQGYWAREHTLVPVPGRTAEAELLLFPTGRVKARVKAPVGESLPRELSLRFSLPPEVADRRGLPGASTLSCPVRDGAWTCEIPAGLLDLRIKGEGWIPAYFWGITVGLGATQDLGPVVLRRGASVAGWVQLEPGEVPLRGIQIELAPESAGIPGTRLEHERLGSLALGTRTNERGFFQFEGVKPGSYVVKAMADGYAPARRGPIEVREGLQSEILEPLWLARPLRLEVQLDPPLDPYGLPWRLRLFQQEAPGELNDGVWNGAADPEGRWVLPGLAPGGYRLVALGDLDSRWLTHEFQLEPGRTALDVRVPVLEVEGSVTLGDEPLSATLWFGGQRGSRRLRFDSDEKGKFSGLLPEEGTWPVDLAAEKHDLRVSLDPVEVNVPPGARKARIELRVPDTLLAGEVVDEAGRKVPGASVMVLSRRGAITRTDENGEFELRGVAPGLKGIEATDGRRTSGAVEVAVEENRETPRVRLVVRETLEIRGRISSNLGPAPGAELLGFPAVDQVGFATGVTAVAGADGSFRLYLPAGTSKLDLLVYAPGFALRMLPALVEKGQALDIHLEPAGGTLILEWPEGGEETLKPQIAHAGTFTAPSLLRRWASLQRAVQSPGRMVIPNVEPGLYSLCTGSASAELRQGKEPPADSRCVSGILPPHSELTLKIPK